MKFAHAPLRMWGWSSPVSPKDERGNLPPLLFLMGWLWWARLLSEEGSFCVEEKVAVGEFGNVEAAEQVFSSRKEDQVESASRIRRNVLPVSWVNVVKREDHASKPRLASRLEFFAPKVPGRPEVIEIEGICLDRGLSSQGPRVLLGQLFKLSFLRGLFPSIV
ncbi:hypothetical protein U1Q18_036431 [Sarracenia purpurea var. burkii]